MSVSAENKARLLLGFVLLLGVAGAAAWYLHLSARYAVYQITTHETVSGLAVDAPVEYHGVEVGKVKSINLTDSQTARVLMSIDKAAPVTTATVATITARGLSVRGFTGYVYVALEDSGTDFRPLVVRSGDKYPAIPAAQSKSVSLDVAIGQVNENVQRLTLLLEDVLDRKTVASLKQSLDDLHRVTGMLADDNVALRSVLVKAERASREIRPFLASTNETMSAVRTQFLPDAHRTLAHLDELSASLMTFASDAQPALDSGRNTIDILRTQLLPQAHRTLATLDDLANSLAGFAEKVNTDPSVIVRGSAPPRPGPGE